MFLRVFAQELPAPEAPAAEEQIEDLWVAIPM